jgi:inner membrane protein
LCEKLCGCQGKIEEVLMFLGFMALTHSLIAAAGTSLILATADPMALGLAILGSQLPDIDTTTPNQ